MNTKLEYRVSFLEKKFDTKNLIYLLPLFILIAKIIRWTVLENTLINFSAGWGYVEEILNGVFSFELFGTEEIIATNSDAAGNAIAIFKILNGLFLNILDDFYSFEIAITIIWNIMIVYLIIKMKKCLTVTQGVFAVCAIILLNIFCFNLAKEPIQFLYFFLIFLVLNAKKIENKHKLTLTLGIILFSAVTFRIYYLLIIYFSCLFYYFFGKKALIQEDSNVISNKKTFIKIFFILICGYLTMMLVFKFALPSYYTRFAETLLFASDATSSSNTYINNIITNSPNNLLLVVIEYSFAVLRLLFPFELISLGPKYWMYILYQFIASLLILRTIKNIKNNSFEQNVALVIMIGFIFASATFEVDFGAWVRHNAITLPIMLVLTNCTPKKHRISIDNIKEKRI